MPKDRLLTLGKLTKYYSHISISLWTLGTLGSWWVAWFARNLLMCCPGGSGQADLPHSGRDSGTIRQELWERVRPSLPPQLQQGRPAVEVLEEPAGKHGAWPKYFTAEVRRRTVGQDWLGGDGEMSQEDSKSGAETCDGVIEQSNGGKNRRKGPAKKRKSGFFHSELLLVIHNRNRGNYIYTPASCWPFEIPSSSPFGHNLNTRSCFCLSLLDWTVPSLTFKPILFFFTLRYYSRKQTVRRDWFVQLVAQQN